jgi:tRNA (guanine37-N1)-methyltransferase
MRIDILTIFPQIFESVFDYSIIGRARSCGLIDIKLHDIRAFTRDKHHVVDDYPFGGGPGMVLKPEPIFESVEFITRDINMPTIPTILMSPQGRLFNQEIAHHISEYQHIILICGRYEGVDERVAEFLATDELSIGDYVLGGGELAAMVVIDCLARLLPGVVGSEESINDDSHSEGLLEYPQYTRPAQFRNWTVPPVLLSGNHAEIALWRRQQSLLRTATRRPELLWKAKLSDNDKLYLRKKGINRN